tara:strand:- start:310 stop:489 length:180 start_codon:yes stop_codon:yes gene_type:complete
VSGFCQSDINDNLLISLCENSENPDSKEFNALNEYYNVYNQVNPESALISLDYHSKLAK